MTDAARPVPTAAQLARPVDQFQRYSLTAALVRLLGVPAGGRVLDVGGSPGPVEEFLPDHRVTVLDTAAAGGGHAGRFVVGDGSRLPFRDRAFDVVVSLDTLEHVPPPGRPAFLAEALRVAEHAVVLSAPFADPAVVLAEDALRQFIAARLAPDFPTARWLTEHRDHGLPGLDDTVAGLGAQGWPVRALPSGYLPRWLATMIADHELLATGLPQLDRLHAYYNSVVSPQDARTPAYRHVVAAVRHRSAGELAAAVDALRSPGDDAQGRAGLLALATAVLARRVDAALVAPGAAELGALRQEVDDLRRQLADRDAHLLERAGQIQHLLHLVEQERAAGDARLREQQALALGGQVRHVAGRLAAAARRRRA